MTNFKPTPEQIDKWADGMLDEATDEMQAKGIDITPESLSKYFEEQYQLPFIPVEAKNWLLQQEWYQKAVAIAATFEAFLASDDFKSGVIKATKASWGGSGYSVELFEDGMWRVLWNNEIGNLYQSPGTILGLPLIGDDDVSQADEFSDEDYLLGEAFEIERDELEREIRERFNA